MTARLWLTVEVPGGTHIDDACNAAVELAGKLGVTVWFKFNDVKCLARPGDDPRAIAADWLEVLHSKSPYKIASA